MAQLKVLSVEEISLKVSKKELIINVSGSVVGNDWSSLKLSIGKENSEDRIYDLNFTGEGSEEVYSEEGSIDELSKEVKVKLILKDFPDNLIGVRVHARENVLEKKLNRSAVSVLMSTFFILLMLYLSFKN